MLFNSIHFLVFFPLVTLLYFAIPHRWRWLLLLAASYYFYMSWRPEYIVLVLLSTLVDYFAGIQMGKTAQRSRRRKFLILSLFSNLGLLFVFKYFNLFASSMDAVLGYLNWGCSVPALDVLLPIGISFYTFQTLSYSIDVYRGKKEPEKHLGIFALYVSFFPQLVAGPIERATRLLPQFHRHQGFDQRRIVSGLQLMLWGFCKKVVIANRLAVMVDKVYGSPTEYSGLPLILATYFFAFQILCDFSGYSDIAVGAAKILGYDLMENFCRPYFAKSIPEFWRRWHISLSTWFRDYLYIPLGGNRVTRERWYLNLFVVFLISGLWHGANWTFAIWGALHGILQVLAVATANYRERMTAVMRLEKAPVIHKFIQVFTTFHLVTFAWIFFRASSASDALHIVSNLFRMTSWSLPFSNTQALLGIGLIAMLIIVQLLQRKDSIRSRLESRPTGVRWAAYYAMILFILYFGVFDQQEFIYFQF